MGLGNYRKNQHSSNLLSRRSSILQVHSGWCTVIAVARICASMAASDRQSGPGEISAVVNEASGVCLPISRTRRTPARNAVTQSFRSRENSAGCGPAPADRARRARADCSRIRTQRADPGLHGADPLVQPYRAHNGQCQRLEHNPQSTHRPRSGRCLAGPLRISEGVEVNDEPNGCQRHCDRQSSGRRGDRR